MISILLFPFKIISLPIKFLGGFFGVFFAASMLACVSAIISIIRFNLGSQMVGGIALCTFICTFWSAYDD